MTDSLSLTYITGVHIHTHWWYGMVRDTQDAVSADMVWDSVLFVLEHVVRHHDQQQQIEQLAGIGQAAAPLSLSTSSSASSSASSSSSSAPAATATAAVAASGGTGDGDRGGDIEAEGGRSYSAEDLNILKMVRRKEKEKEEGEAGDEKKRSRRKNGLVSAVFASSLFYFLLYFFSMTVCHFPSPLPPPPVLHCTALHCTTQSPQTDDRQPGWLR